MHPQDRPSDYDPYAWENNPPGARAEIVRMVRRLPPTGIDGRCDELPILEREPFRGMRRTTRYLLQQESPHYDACAHCHERAWELQVDHIVSLSQNGRHALENMQLLCLGCHKAKTAAERREARLQRAA